MQISIFWCANGRREIQIMTTQNASFAAAGHYRSNGRASLYILLLPLFFLPLLVSGLINEEEMKKYTVVVYIICLSLLFWVCQKANTPYVAIAIVVSLAFNTLHRIEDLLIELSQSRKNEHELP